MSTAWDRLVNEPILDIQPYQPGKALRITAGTPEENARLIETLRSVVWQEGGRS